MLHAVHLAMFYPCLCQVFFNPEIYSNDFTTPLPAVIDKCIQSAPIDTRRALYKVRCMRDGGGVWSSEDTLIKKVPIICANALVYVPIVMISSKQLLQDCFVVLHAAFPGLDTSCGNLSA